MTHVISVSVVKLELCLFSKCSKLKLSMNVELLIAIKTLLLILKLLLYSIELKSSSGALLFIIMLGFFFFCFRLLFS